MFSEALTNGGPQCIADAIKRLMDGPGQPEGTETSQSTLTRPQRSLGRVGQ